MYYVNREQIDLRLRFLPTITQLMRSLRADWQGDNVMQQFALERAVHLAAECVTDVGSYLIDGFLMRDASSYEDIVDILYGEKAISDHIQPILSALVRQRKPLVQLYYLQQTDELTQFLDKLPDVLESFATEINTYIELELSR